MGSEFVQDPFWGNWASGLVKSIQGSTGTALHNAATVESILKAREDRARETEKWNAGKSAADLVDAQTPQAKVDPSFRDVTVENQGPVNPADPTTQPGEIFLPPTTARESFIDPRALAAAEARRAYGVAGTRASVLKDPSTWAAQGAHAEIAATGMPTDPRERGRLQAQMTGRFPTSEESKTPNAQNFSVVDAQGNAIGTGYASLTGGRTAVDGTVIKLGPGERIMETGPAPLAAPNPLKDEASARERLAVLSRSIGPNGPSQDQAVQIQQLVDVAYRPERVVEKVGDQMQVKYVQKNPIPSWVTAMMGAPPPAAAASVAPPPAPVTGPQPNPLDPNDPNAGIPVSPVAAAPPPAPFNPNADRTVEVQPGSAIELRKEYHGLPDIQRYVKTAGTWNSTVQHAYAGNKAADLALVYGFIKMMDDLTGVREGETKLVSNVGSWAEQANTWLGNAKGTGLDSETRVKIVDTMQRTMDEIRAAAQAKERLYTQAAVDSKLAPKAVLGELMPMVEFDRARARAVRSAAPAGGRSAPHTSTTAAPTTATDPQDAATAAAKEALRAKLYQQSQPGAP